MYYSNRFLYIFKYLISIKNIVSIQKKNVVSTFLRCLILEEKGLKYGFLTPPHLSNSISLDIENSEII